ncbi:hypothetical protein [Actinoplanes regularis]|uniref:Uncharacterized protein n=1 Tax=Actinoplanes regularis TaxID=52697 RepID=A0A238YSH1_9ACTN|nr:hypothetical protein [Actinoplanes regularis]GIE85530.1 hypothetical protein Are01nite_20100 [Actinoplanes regularis]SNR74087.1 hypothetical protein SAMN06264365_105152 [Actinoplanes regularis]
MIASRDDRTISASLARPLTACCSAICRLRAKPTHTAVMQAASSRRFISRELSASTSGVEIHRASTIMQTPMAATARGLAEPTARHGPTANMLKNSCCVAGTTTAAIADTVTAATATINTVVDDNIKPRSAS